MKNILKYTLLASSLVLAFACTKDFEKINTDPDAYTTAPATNQLALVLTQTANQIADITGPNIWAGYMSKLSYIDQYNDYIPTNNTYGNKWAAVYRCSTQLQDIINRTDETGTKNMRNVARTYRAFLLLWNLDNFGDMPYSEAWKGAPEDGGILQSKYDKQEDVYPAVLAELGEVADSWAAGLGSDAIGSGDFLFGGDASKWQRFCNSLRLRYAIRLARVWGGAQALAESIMNNPTKYPVIEENSQRAYFVWQGSGDYFEPWYDTFRTRPNDWCASEIFVNYLLATNDPRLKLYVQPCRADGTTYRGGEHGIASQQLSNQTRYSFLGEAYMTANNTGFTPYYKACETYFNMCEAAMRGWNTPLTDEEAYNKAVRLSFEDEMNNANGFVPEGRKVTEEEVEAYLAGPGEYDFSLNCLFYQEWVAFFKQPYEAWCMYRRTGFPQYIQTAVYSGESAQIYANAGCVAGERQYPGDRADAYWGEGVHTDVPFRMPYPNNQFTYNKANVEAASEGIVDYCWGKHLWWDLRTDVK